MENTSPAGNFYERKADVILWTFGGLGLFFIAFGGIFLAQTHESLFIWMMVGLGVPMLLAGVIFGFLVLDISAGTITFGYGGLRPRESRGRPLLCERDGPGAQVR